MREMKNSGIDYIGVVPNKWDIDRAKFHFTERTTKGNYRNLELLSPTQKYGVIPQSLYEELSTQRTVKVDEKKDLSQFKTIHKGDFCISLRSFQGGLEFCEYEGVVSPAYKVFYPINRMYRGYYKFMFKCDAFISKIASYSDSLRDGKSITFEQFGNTFICIPPLCEQGMIADFLENKCSEIDSLTSDIQTQIDTLEEYKKSVITEAVTKGLNPDVEMKDSGIEWIGMIANHATVIRLKHFSYMKGRIGWQGLKANDFIEKGPYCITGTDFINGKVNWETCYHVSEERYEMDSNIQVKIGDLLMTKDGTIGKLAIIDELPDKACLNSHLLIIRPLENKYTNKYLFYVMKSHIFSKYYNLVSSGSTMDSLSQEKTGNFSIPIFEIKKQQEIVDYLDAKCTEIDGTIVEKKEQLEVLEQYKKSLIYEYVTGKKEVPTDYE